MLATSVTAQIRQRVLTRLPASISMLPTAPAPKAPEPKSARQRSKPKSKQVAKDEDRPLDISRRIQLLLRTDPAYPWKAARIVTRYDMSPRVREKGHFRELVDLLRRDPGVSPRLLDQAQASISGARATRARKFQHQTL